MTLAPRGVRIGLAVLGLGYGVPIVVFGYLQETRAGAVLAAVGLAVSLMAAGRAFRIRLNVDRETITVVNRWRTASVPVRSFDRFEEDSPWWATLTGSAPVLAVRSSDRRLAVPAIVTLGMSPESPEITTILRLIRDLQRGASRS